VVSADAPPPGTSTPGTPPDASPASAPPRRDWLGFVTTRPVAITMFMVAIAVFGMVSFGKLPLDLLPEISYPTITVRTTWRGAAPEDVEDRVSERIQEALSTLPHLVRSTSISRAEVSDVVLDFEWKTPMTFAVQDVRDKLDGVFLPEGAERPLILRYDPNLDPILRVAVSVPAREAAGGSRSQEQLIQLRWIAEHRLKRELEALPGVAAVDVRGGLIEEIRVRTDPFKMAAQGLDPTALANRLAQENINASGGLIREGSTEYLVRTLNEFQDVDEIADLAIERRGDAAIRVRDVAQVSRSHAERDVVTRLSGDEAVELAIYREAGANIVELAQMVKDKLFGTASQQAFTAQLAKRGRAGATLEERERSDYLAWRLRDEARLELLSDQSLFIRDAVDDLKSSAVIGALLSVLVLWVFLRDFPATLIIGVTVPITVVATFAPMFMLGVSLNIMSLGGLALGVGMLLDNSIVVLESITRCRSEGDSLLRAAVRGVQEVAAPMLASTLTTVSVFAPIVFVHGIAGQIFGDQAVTVVTSQIVSYVIGIIFIPMLASRTWLVGGARAGEAPARPGRLREGLDFRLGQIVPSTLLFLGRGVLVLCGWIARAIGALWLGLAKLGSLLTALPRRLFDRLWGSVERGYPRLVAGSLRRPWLVVASALALFALAAWRVSELGVELLPEVHQGEFTLHVGLEVGSPLENTDQVLSSLDRRIRDLEGVRMTALTVGVEKDTLTREIEGKHTARLTVRLKPEAASAEKELAVLAQARALLAAHPSIRSVEVTRPTPFALEAPITVEVLGYDLERMHAVARQVQERLGTVEGLTDIRSTVRPGHPEVRITFDRDKTLEYGLDLGSVSKLVRDQVLGNVSTRFTDGDDHIDVRVLGDEAILSNLDHVLDLVVNPGSDSPVELRSVASIERVEGPAEIRRIGNTRAVLVTAATTGLNLGGLTREVEKSLASLTPPDDVTVQLGGQKRELDQAQRSMQFALLLALFLVYVVMACEFESLLQPLVILVTAPLAGVGVVFVLEGLGTPISITVFLGMILLAGIVVNNAIVLIDRVNQRRAAGDGLAEALIEAGGTRLRPILMTTATAVLGLLPLTGWMDKLPFIASLGGGAGAELRAPMAITVIAGLSSATLLTLVVIPVVYYLAYRGRAGAKAAA
jgi:hydrophobic/amphiphilic exporter-1 (mainly G- bacteria), HAE1 family